MSGLISAILKIDKNIRKFYYIYSGVFGVIFMLFLVSIIMWERPLKILLTFWVLISYLFLLRPCIKDFCSATEGKYCIVEGEILEKVKSVESWRVIDIINRKGKCIKGINLFYKQKLDDRFGTIEYLPNTKFGRIIEISK